MAEDVGTLVARVVADTENFRSEMTRVAKTLESNTARMNAALAKVNTGVLGLGKGFTNLNRIAGLFGVTLSARALGRWFQGYAESALEANKLTADQAKILGDAKTQLGFLNDEFEKVTRTLVVGFAPAMGEAAKRLRALLFPTDAERALRKMQGDLSLAKDRVDELHTAMNEYPEGSVKRDRAKLELEAAERNVADFKTRIIPLQEAVNAEAGERAAVAYFKEYQAYFDKAKLDPSKLAAGIDYNAKPLKMSVEVDLVPEDFVGTVAGNVPEWIKAQQKFVEEQQKLIKQSADTHLETLDAELTDAQKMWQGFSKSASHTLTDSLSDAFLGIDSNWKDLLKRMAADWAAQTFVKGIGAAIGGPIGEFISGTLFEHRAGGGPVSPGQGYMVGERGPEWFSPSVSGTILPSGAGGVVINQTHNIDARGASNEGLQQLISALPKILADNRTRTMYETFDFMKRHGAPG